MPTFASLFSGLGCFDLAFRQAGFDCLWSCEIDPECRRVLRHHWPDLTIYDDVKDIDGSTVAVPDIVIGGFPCQDLSVAGRRAGLAGGRSGLWWEFRRVLAEVAPRWCLIENVPGLLSSWSPVEPPPDAVEGREWEVEETSDLETILTSLAELGYWWAYRSLDCQYDGLAQQRERVFIVGCSGKPRRLAGKARRKDARRFRSLPAKVLFEPESLCGPPAPCRQAGTGAAAGVTVGAGGEGSGGQLTADGVSPCLRTNQHNNSDPGMESRMVVAAPCAAATLSAGPAASPGVNPPGRRQEDDVNLVVCVTGAVSHTLSSEGADASEDGTGRGTPIVPMAFYPDGGTWDINARDDLSPTLKIGGSVGIPSAPPVLTGCGFAELGEGHATYQATETAASLRTTTGGGGTKANLVTQGVIPISADAAAGRSGDALTPSADAEGVVRLRAPSLVVGEAGQPSFSLSAASPPAVAHITPAPHTVIPIDMRQASRGEKMTNDRSEATVSGGAPGMGVGQEDSPAPSLAETHTPAVAYGIGPDAVDRSGEGSGGTPGERSGMNLREELQPTLRARPTNSVAYIVNAAESCAVKDHARQADYARSLDTTGSFATNQGGTVVVGSLGAKDSGWRCGPDEAAANQVVPFNIIGMAQQGGNHAYETDVSDCLQHKGLCPTGNEAGTVITGPALAFQERGREGGRSVETQADLAYALTNPGEGGRTQERNVLTPAMMVRRLTPVECLRLQGLPSDYLGLDPPLSDSAKYRMIANSGARPVLLRIASRLKAVHEEG